MFKKITIKIFIISMILLMCGTDTLAQTRIRFARGRYSATVSGSLPFNYYREYVVRARAGQSLIAKVTSGTGQVVFAEDYETQYFLDLNEDGDYTIQIMNTGPATWYRLTVTIVRTPR
jgi:hypothetical protein